MKASPLTYNDYRSFLADHVAAKKRQSPAWSYTVWARQLGLKSSSTLIMILNGQRNPGKGLVEGLCRYFSLNEREGEYFSDLVKVAKAKSDVEASLTVLRKLANRNEGFRLIDLDAFQTISNWHYYAIRELVNVKGFREDPEWIVSKLQFPLSPQKVGEAIETLLRLGLLVRNGRGKLLYTSQHVETTSDRAHEGLKRYNEQMLENAKRAIREVPPEEREISGGCFAIKAKSLKRAKEMIRAFQVELCNELEEKNADRVYQIHVGFFPLSRETGEVLQ